jgi:hypothetical protein
LQYETATAFDNQGVTPTFSREAASQLGSYGKSGLEVSPASYIHLPPC